MQTLPTHRLNGRPNTSEWTYWPKPTTARPNARPQNHQAPNRRVDGCRSAPSDSEPHLLIVDDYPDNQLLLQSSLEDQGYRVTAFADGLSALDFVAANPGETSLILLDLMMPGIDGMEVLSSVREYYSRHELPVIMTTALGDDENVIRALKGGANDFVTKPLQIEPLIERVRTQLELAESRLSLEKEVRERRRAQARSEQMAAGLKAATRSAGIGVWEWDPESGELLWGPALRKLLGFEPSESEVVEGGWRSVVHPDDLQLLEREFEEALKEGADFHSKFRIVRPDGEVRLLEGHASVQQSAEGEVKLIGANWDITEKQQAREAVLEASERERRRIGRDLHDGLCQELGGLGLLVSALEARLLVEQNSEAESAAKLGECVLQATEHARALAHGLSPLDADRQTLSEALEALVNKQRKATPEIEIELVLDSDLEPLPAPQATELYFIASEAFANALRHGSPSLVLIELSKNDAEVVLKIADNGGGRAEQLLGADGLGVHSMRHRAWTLGGVIAFENAKLGGASASSHGIQVECHVPTISPPSSNPPKTDDPQSNHQTNLSDRRSSPSPNGLGAGL